MNSQRIAPVRLLSLLLASLLTLILALTFLPLSAFAGPSYTLNFAASAPGTYNHATGGGAFDDATKNADIVESLEGGDFACGDVVTFLVLIEAPDDLASAETLLLDFSFTGDTTGQSGVAISEVLGVSINNGSVSGGDGPSGTDSAQAHDGGSVATFTGGQPNGPLFEAGTSVNAQVKVTDVEAGEKIVLRVDVPVSRVAPRLGTFRRSLRALSLMRAGLLRPL
jgi:hypothetical protein